MTGIDHGELNTPLTKRYGKGGIDAALSTYTREQAKRIADIQKANRKAAREAEAARPRLSPEDFDGARFVRDGGGWYKVARVNAKTVTVQSGFGEFRIGFDKIHEVRR
ncbi:MAG: hypothetical protein PGN07_04650 [Aeromicrobium erythreum]